MIEVEDVWRLIDELCAPLAPGPVALADAFGLTLAEDVAADRDGPPFDRSAVDGYAVRADDDSVEFRVIHEIAAGESVRLALDVGQAVRIFTGAELPAADLRVIMQEDTTRDGDVLCRTERGTGKNFCARGEDFRAGERLLAAGTRLDAAALAVLASVGHVHPRAIRPPRILHFTTGDEIVAPGTIPEPAQIRDANAVLIRALLRGSPVASFEHAHLPDDEAEGLRRIRAIKPEACDVLLFSGGSSVGNFDFTGRFLDALGFERRCAQVNVRPGKPLIFATRGARVAFGLPGNPLSHFACFHLFVARALDRLRGQASAGLDDARLASAIPGRSNPRVTYWPARSGRKNTETWVTPLPWNSSGHLAALPGVDALIRIAANAGLPNPGETVQILPVA